MLPYDSYVASYTVKKWISKGIYAVLYYNISCLSQAPLTEESWEARNKLSGQSASVAAAGDENYDYYQPDADTIMTEQVMDLLIADEPAYYSDEFSNPDDEYYDDNDEYYDDEDSDGYNDWW